MLKWDNLVPTSYKKSSINTLVDRAVRLCSRFDLLHDELIYIRSTADFNGYPSYFVENIIRKHLNSLYEQKSTELPLNDNKKYKFIRVPYIGEPSYTYAKRLKSIIMQNDPTADLRAIFQTSNETRKYFPNKDRLSPGQQSGVVYQISCIDRKKTYIGKTIRQRYRRVTEHEQDVCKAQIFLHGTSSLRRTRSKKKQHQSIANSRIKKKAISQPTRRSDRIQNQRQNQSQHTQSTNQTEIKPYKPKSALGKHTLHTGHFIDFEHIETLNADQFNYKLLIKESIHIRSIRPQLNGTDTSVPLYVFPEGLKKR